MWNPDEKKTSWEEDQIESWGRRCAEVAFSLLAQSSWVQIFLLLVTLPTQQINGSLPSGMCCEEKSDRVEDMIFSLFPSALTPYDLERAGSLKKCLGLFFPAVRFEPGTAGYEGRTLPQCHAAPQRLKTWWNENEVSWEFRKIQICFLKLV